MNWATNYIIKLQSGETISFRPRGNSMSGKINSGQLCTLEPIKEFISLIKGDIVLCKVNGNVYLHLIETIDGDRYKICNNHGYSNGWTNKKNIYGKCIKIED